MPKMRTTQTAGSGWRVSMDGVEQPGNYREEHTATDAAEVLLAEFPDASVEIEQRTKKRVEWKPGQKPGKPTKEPPVEPPVEEEEPPVVVPPVEEPPVEEPPVVVVPPTDPPVEPTGGLYPDQPASFRVIRDQFFQRGAGTAEDPNVFAKGPNNQDRSFDLYDDLGVRWNVNMNRNPLAELRRGVEDPDSPTGRPVGELFFPNGLADGEDLMVIGAGPPLPESREAFIAHLLKFSPGFVYHRMGVKMTILWLDRGGNPYTLTLGGATDGGHTGQENYFPPKLGIGSRGMSWGLGPNTPPMIDGEVFRYNVAIPPEIPSGEYINWQTRIHMGTPGRYDGRLRMWINRLLVIDYQGVRFPDDARSIGTYTMPFTWGGGGVRLAQDQWIRFANTRIAVPG